MADRLTSVSAHRTIAKKPNAAIVPEACCESALTVTKSIHSPTFMEANDIRASWLGQPVRDRTEEITATCRRLQRLTFLKAHRFYLSHLRIVSFSPPLDS